LRISTAGEYNQISMRAVSTSIMAVLVVVALFWGNCYSCPEALLALTAHHCCHPTKAPAAGCETQNLQNFVKANPDMSTSALPVVAIASQPAAPVVFSARAVGIEYTPPDLFSLHSVFRI
jgi:hypothetical protein